MLRNLLLASLLAFAVPCHAQTNCPGTTYLGWGQGITGTYPNATWTNFSASFPNGSGIATCNGPLELDADNNFPTCNPSTWNCPSYNSGWHVGDVSYNDGTLSYTGKARFWFHLVPASTPNCVPDKDYVPRSQMVARLKIQSCTNSHTLTNRFLAVSCDGSYCEQWVGPACTNSGGYYHENWIDLQISGF